MNHEFSSSTTEELLMLFHQVNSELAKEFSNHASWQDQQLRIQKLSLIAEELRIRKSEKTVAAVQSS